MRRLHMQRTLAAMLVSLGLAWQLPAIPAAQQSTDRELSLAFDGRGNVTLHAANVTIREILAEWSRQGGVAFLNAEKLTGGPVSMLRFDDRPEAEVIDSLLRSAAGYILGPRTVRTQGPSRFEAVVILASSSPTTSRAYGSPSAPVAAPLRTPGFPDDEIPPVTPPAGANEPASAPATSTPPPFPSAGPGVVIVPIQPVTPVTGRGGGAPPPTPPPPTGSGS